MAGCTQPSTAGSTSVVPPTAGVLGEFELYADPTTGRFEMTKQVSQSTSGLSSATVVQNGVPGAGPANTLELVTTNGTNDLGGGGVCGYPSSYCGTVTVRSFYTGPIGSVFALVDSVTPASGHTGLNSDGSSNGLSNALGLWGYGDLAAGASGARQWVFSDDGTPFRVHGRVMADLCNDGIQDGDETGVDCGGSCAASCGTCAGPCDANATCQDQGGGTFACVCNSGYSGDGSTCTDIDECALNTDTCLPAQLCTNTAGSYTCGPCVAPYDVCGGVCTNLLNDVNNCRFCGNPCESTQACANALCVGSGNLGVSLVWTRAGDLDLWLRTPNGNIIGYWNMGPAAGTDWGQQDHDDTTGTGPENMFWDVLYTPPNGTYNVCADMYSFSPDASGADPIGYTVVVKRPLHADVTFTGTYTANSRATSCLPGEPAYVGSFTYP